MRLPDLQGGFDAWVRAGGATKHHGVDGLLTAVMDAVQSWSSGRDQGDDITLVGLAAS